MYYDYRAYLNQLIQNTDGLEQGIQDVFTRIDDLYNIVAVVLALVSGILAYLLIKNWRFRTK